MPCGSSVLGSIPEIPLFGIRGGPIYLREGVHKAKNKGFGAYHIFAEHRHELEKFECYSFVDVAIFIKDKLIIRNADIYCEYSCYRGNNRVTVLRNRYGTLVLEPRHERVLGFCYQVVTWYSNRRAHGTLVGKIA